MELKPITRVSDAMTVRCQNLVDTLDKHPYILADTLSRYLKIPVFKVYGAVRKLREVFMVGITNTPKGYILSKDAKMRDDAYHLRLLLGRRNSIIVTLEASRPYINKRWNRNVKDGKHLRSIIPQLLGNQKKINSGLTICLTKSKVHQI